MKRAIQFLIIAAFAIPFSLGALTGAAHAATCSGHGCDGKDPAQTGCNVGAVQLGIVLNTWENATDNRDNQVWWSNNCQSNFGLIYSFSGQPLSSVAIYRSDQSNKNCNDNNGTACTVNGQACFGINGCDVSTSGGNALLYCATPITGCLSMASNTTSWETDLLYAPNQQVQVCQLPRYSGDLYCSAWH